MRSFLSKRIETVFLLLFSEKIDESRFRFTQTPLTLQFLPKMYGIIRCGRNQADTFLSTGKKSNSIKKTNLTSSAQLANASCAFSAATVELMNRGTADALAAMHIDAARTDAAATCKTQLAKTTEGRDYLRFALAPLTDITEIDPKILAMMYKVVNSSVTAAAAASRQLSNCGYELNRLSCHPHATHLATMPSGREIYVDLRV